VGQDFGEGFVKAANGDPASSPRNRDEWWKEPLKHDPRGQLIGGCTLDQEKEVSIGHGVLWVETKTRVAQDLIKVPDRRLGEAPGIDPSKCVLSSRQSAPFGSEIPQHRIGTGGVGEDVVLSGFR